MLGETIGVGVDCGCFNAVLGGGFVNPSSAFGSTF